MSIVRFTQPSSSVPLSVNAALPFKNQHRRLATVMASLVLASVLGACSSTPKSPSAPKPASTKPSGSGGYYLDDGPGADAARNSPAFLDAIPDAVPRTERYHSGANRPYTVFGRSYVPVINNDPFRQQGVASWYGRKYHGNMTSIGEIYDMYAMTAAHPTLPLPAYVRVTNPANQKSVVVRVNDRGPFHSDRIIDLSYAAAYRIGIAQRGSAPVVVERVFAGEANRNVSPTVQSAQTTQLAANSQPQPAPVTTPLVVAAPITAQPLATPPSSPTTSAPIAASASTTVPTTVTTSPIVSDGNALYLQLGAFSSRENAEIFRARLTKEFDWNREPITATQINGLWRVRMGPYASRTEADAIIERIKSSHDFAPVIARP